MNDLKHNGNNFLDKLLSGPYVPNPKYNAKTKAGRTQPQFLVDTTPGDLYSSDYGDIVRGVHNRFISPREVGKSLEDLEEDFRLNLGYNIYNTEDELNDARAEAQSALEKWGRFGGRLANEIVVGTLEGIGNIYDGIVNSFTGDNYDKNAFTRTFENLKENIDTSLKIHQSDPNESWNMGDLGWWLNNGVNVASTLSLLLPAAGWAKGIGMLGKATRANKLLGAANKAVSRALSKSISKLDNVGEELGHFGAMRNAVARTNRIEKAINDSGKIGGLAYLQRTGENYIEAKEVYHDVYETNKERLNSMSEQEFAKFLEYNPEYKDFDKDDIAKDIAYKSANKTFREDYWMLLMDIAQFKALGSLWGKGIRRSPNARERIAAKNQKAKLAGAKEEDLIKDTFKNRVKDNVKYALSKPLNSVHALQLSEGFEEIFQGIQIEKGKEVSERYFDPAFDSRSLSSYLTDGHIWEQGFWGVIGGITFTAGHGGIKKASRAIDAYKRKKTMTAEEYQRWKTGEDKQSIERINNTTNRIDAFINEMEAIDRGENPYEFDIDPLTGKPYYNETGQLARKKIADESEKELVKQRAIKEFVDDAAFDALDAGTFDLMTDILGSEEFNKYIKNKGFNLTATDSELARQVVKRMKDVEAIYNNEIANIYGIAGISNPYVNNAVARQIARHRLQDIDVNAEIAELDRLIKNNSNDADYTNYINLRTYNIISEYIKKLESYKQQYKQRLDAKQIGQSAYDRHVREIEAQQKELFDYVANTTEKGAIEALQKELKNNSNFDDLNKAFDDFVSKFTNDNFNTETPPSNITALINKKIDAAIRRSLNKANIPLYSKDYEQIHEDFSAVMDMMVRKRSEEYIDVITNYLKNAKDFDKAVESLYTEKTNNKELKEALQFFQYGYFNPYNEIIKAKQFDALITIPKIIESVRKEVQNEKEQIAVLEEKGFAVPVDESNISEKPKEETVDELVNDESPSTGEELKEDTIDSDVQQIVVEENKQLQEQPDVEHLIGLDENTDEHFVDEESIIQGDNSEIERLKIDAASYFSLLGFKQPAVFDNLLNGNQKDIEKLIDDCYNAFKNKYHFNEQSAKDIINKQLISTINAFSNSNISNKNTFKQLAESLILGVDKDTDITDMNAVTELIGKPCPPKVVEDFLEQYIKDANIIKTDDVAIINIASLFDYIIHNENINADKAARIYERINDYLKFNPGTKYKFTGFAENYNNLTPAAFINQIKENKKQVVRESNFHFDLIEPQQRDKEFEEALLSYANGRGTCVAVPYYNSEGIFSHISIFVTHEYIGARIDTKIGTLRSVNWDGTRNQYYPKSFQSGFYNMVTNNNGNITLDCDFLFESILKNKEEKSNDEKELTDILFKYVTEEIALREKYNNDYKKIEAGRLEYAKSVQDKLFNNPIIKKLLQDNHYNFYTTLTNDKVSERALALLHDINQILFFKHRNLGGIKNSVDIANNYINANLQDMRNNYLDWKEKVFNNYKHTYELQKGLTGKDSKVAIKLNIPVESYLNISEDKNHKLDAIDLYKYTRIENGAPILVQKPDKDKELIGSNGKLYGFDSTVERFSMGVVIANPFGKDHVLFFNEANELNNDIKNAIYKELLDLINLQFNNNDTVSNFDTITERLNELIGYGGLFYGKNVKVITQTTNDYSACKITLNEVPIISINKFTKEKKNHSKIVSIGIGDNKYINVTSNTFEENKKLIENKLIELVKSLTFNRSNKAFNNKLNSIIDTNNGFTLNIGGFRFTAKNYADFLLKQNAFSARVEVRNGEIVTNVAILKDISIDTNITTTPNVQVKDNQAVADTLLNGERTRKTVDSAEILSLANVPQEHIDLLTGKSSGVQLVSSRVYIDENDESRFAYYRAEKDLNTGKSAGIYVTAKGLRSMTSADNTIRLLVHENIHRLFHLKGTYDDVTRRRIIKELDEVYTYTKECLEKDLANKRISTQLYNSIQSVFNKIDSNKSKDVQMEEFLTECLSQKLLIKYLNNTEYKYEVDVENISGKKSIFQKIIDLLLNLFTLGNDKIKNNSILARQYQILTNSKDDTDGGMFKESIEDNTSHTTQQTTEEETTPPVEGNTNILSDTTSETEQALNNVEAEINQMIDGFSSRITRDDNFVDNHIYYIDGRPIDSSVTQLIHGKQDIGEWGVISSGLGNTIDEAARQFFEPQGLDNLTNIPNVLHVENTTDSLLFGNTDIQIKNDLNRLKEYFDEIYGNGNYRIITKEFPIGGVVNNKTVAGTMDLLLYTADGRLIIYDFKTKRGGEFTNENIDGYQKQLNIYRQLIEENYPQFKGRIEIGGLIKFTTKYPSPSEVSYRKHPDIPNQIQVFENGEWVNIQSSNIEYAAPYFDVNGDFKDNIVQVQTKDFNQEIFALPEQEEDIDTTDNYNINAFDELDNIIDELDDEFGAETELIRDNENSIETYTARIAKGDVNNAFGIEVVNNMIEYVNSFPNQFQSNIQHLIDSNEINYTCR